jgi:hypothetical protein
MFYGNLPFDGVLLTVFGPVVLLAQLACLIHVIKTGRPYWWMWVIFGFPVIGLAAYIFLEVRPSLGKMNLQALLWRLKSRSERIEILRQNLEESSTVRNRLALSDELHDAGMFNLECDVLTEGLRGAFKDDATLLMRLSQAHLEAGRAAEAEAVLSRTPHERSYETQQQRALLTARVDAACGRHAEAEKAFREQAARKKSEAPRYYLAEFLYVLGRGDEAAAILRDILHQYRRGTPVWRFQERRWYYAAKKLLRTSRPG